MSGTDHPSRQDLRDALMLMSIVHALVAGLAWALTPLLTALQRRRTLQSARTGGGSPAERAVAALRGAVILRLALLEAPALLGLIICLLAVATGQMREQGLYWLNAVSAVLFIAFAALSFPTRERVETLLRARFLD